MHNTAPSTITARSRERFLAVVGATVCLIVSVRIWQVLGSQQPMWPLPGLYVLELLAVSAVGMLGIFRDGSEQFASGATLTWAAVGVLFGFGVMGAWSIGLVYLPVAAIFLIAAIVSDRRRHQTSAAHVGVGVLAALAQVALMLAVVGLSNW
jgi:hypothetical protein